MFKRRKRVTFLKTNGDLTSIYGTATGRAGPYGTDSLDLLAAAAASGSVAKVVRRFGLDPSLLAGAADEARASRHAGPGLTDDAKRVVEAVAHRSLERRRDPSGPDLLIALASVETAARAVLMNLGVDEPRLRAVVE
jgi:Clp amino terminal domain, pathogenicity island component